jgi:DNA ligase D-like protein (predicted ligase)
MLIAQNKPAFDSEDHLFELKLDGLRALAYLDGNATEIRNKRNKSLTAAFPELSRINKRVKKRCILDGEVIIMAEGKPSFADLQRRTLMSNPFRIKLAADALPASFVAFDILFSNNEQVTSLPLTERKKLLEDMVAPSERIAVSKTIEANGIALFNAAAKKSLEGIVAKRKDSLYFFGKRTKTWIKCKALLDEDFVACGYYRKSESLTSVILGSFAPDSSIIYRGHAVMGVSSHDLSLLERAEMGSKNLYPLLPSFPAARWLKPSLVCTVQYMELTRNGGLRQPVFKGFRDDKSPFECTTPPNLPLR